MLLFLKLCTSNFYLCSQGLKAPSGPAPQWTQVPDSRVYWGTKGEVRLLQLFLNLFSEGSPWNSCWTYEKLRTGRNSLLPYHTKCKTKSAPINGEMGECNKPLTPTILSLANGTLYSPYDNAALCCLWSKDIYLCKERSHQPCPKLKALSAQ